MIDLAMFQSLNSEINSTFGRFFHELDYGDLELA